MSERPSGKQNWQKRQNTSFGPHFRIETGNPQMGLNGTITYDLFAQTESGDKSTVGMSNGGIYHIYNDQCIEMIGGQEDQSGGVNIQIVSKNGDVWITAEKNGEVKIRGKNIVIDADEDIDLVAGNYITMDAKNRILLKSNVADCDALRGNLTPRDVTFMGQVFKNAAGGTDVTDMIPTGGGIKLSESLGTIEGRLSGQIGSLAEKVSANSGAIQSGLQQAAGGLSDALDNLGGS